MNPTTSHPLSAIAASDLSPAHPITGALLAGALLGFLYSTPSPSSLLFSFWVSLQHYNTSHHPIILQKHDTCIFKPSRSFHTRLPLFNISKTSNPQFHLHLHLHHHSIFIIRSKNPKFTLQMASESEPSLSPLIHRLTIMPLFASITPTRPEPDPNHDSNDPSPDRIILINPLTQGMVVIGGSETGFDSLMNDLTKDGVPPASESSIESLPTVEIKCGDEIEQLGGECVICLEELGVGDLVTEMPCKHRFHGGCVKRWLKVHGSCPICRYKMPVADDMEKKIGGRRREIWLTFAFGDGRSRSESESLSDESAVELNDS